LIFQKRKILRFYTNINKTNRDLFNSYGFLLEDNKSQYSVMEIALSKKILMITKYIIVNIVNSLIDPLFEEYAKSFFDQKSQTFNLFCKIIFK